MARLAFLPALVLVAPPCPTLAQQAPPTDPVLIAAKAAADTGHLAKTVGLSRQATGLGNATAREALARLGQ